MENRENTEFEDTRTNRENVEFVDKWKNRENAESILWSIKRPLLPRVPRCSSGVQRSSRVAHSRVMSTICDDFNGAFAEYDPTEMTVTGRGHVATYVTGR